jgi:small subunit ribosomal protein S6
MKYEINFLVLQSNTENLEKIKGDVKTHIETRGGKITDLLEYKKRKLAYKIKHEQYGFFTVFRFAIEEGEMIEKIKKDLNLLQTVARYIIVKADELPSLKEETPEKQEKAQMDSKNTIKQEDVEQILSKKKTTKVDTKKKVEEKIVEKKEEKVVEEKKVEQVKEKAKEENKVEEPEKTPKQEEPAKEETTAAKKEKETEDNKSSLEDLDKKLDEILNS